LSDKFRLIQPIQEDPEPLHITVRTSQQERVSNAQVIKRLFFVFYTVCLCNITVVIGLGVYPNQVYAGTFSLFSEVFAQKINTDKTVEHNSSHQTTVQNMALLEAPRSAMLNKASGGGDILIHGKNALQSTGRVGENTRRNTAQKNGQIRVYVVREKDNLSEIADMFDVTTNTIRWSNDIDADEAIQPGQKLVILPITGIRHTIETGDTISTIAETYDGNVNEIREFNNININQTLSVGDTIIIPNGELTITPRSKKYQNQNNTPQPEHSTPQPRTNGYYAHPAPGASLTQGRHGYNAVDFGASVGTPISAAASGQVIISKQGGWNGGYGSYIVIDHSNGSQTLYAHNSRNSVSVGQYVTQGQVIGYIGSTGRSTGPHVHFEVRGNRNPFF